MLQAYQIIARGVNYKYTVNIPRDGKILSIFMSGYNVFYRNPDLHIVVCANTESATDTVPVKIMVLTNPIIDKEIEEYRYFIGNVKAQVSIDPLILLCTHNLFPSNSVDLFARTTISK